MMLGAEPLRGQSRKRSFIVEFLAAETNRKGVNSFGRLLHGATQNNGRVYAPAKQHTQRDIADHVVANSRLQQLSQLFTCSRQILTFRAFPKLQIPILL